MWPLGLVGLVIASLFLAVLVQGVIRRELRLRGPTIINQDRHPVWFWLIAVFLALGGLAGLLGAIGTLFS
jgi:hypothetical protein